MADGDVLSQSDAIFDDGMGATRGRMALRGQCREQVDQGELGKRVSPRSVAVGFVDKFRGHEYRGGIAQIF